MPDLKEACDAAGYALLDELQKRKLPPQMQVPVLLGVAAALSVAQNISERAALELLHGAFEDILNG